MNKNIKWIIIFAIICAVCLAVWGKRPAGSDIIAEIAQDGKVIKEIDLSALTVPYEFEVKDSNGGSNTIRAEHGKIAVIKADCPDKICVHQGYIDNGAAPIVCLPHRLSITVKGAGGNAADAVAGGE